MGDEQGDLSEKHFSRVAILVLLFVLAAGFLYIIRDFLIALLMAAIFSSLAHPIFSWLLKRLGNRRALAAGITLFILILAVVLPLLGLLGLVAEQAIEVSSDIVPWVKAQVKAQQNGQLRLPEWIPFANSFSTSDVTARVGQMIETMGSHVVENITAASKGTADFFLKLFVMLYAMYACFINGDALRDRVNAVVPLADDAKQRLVEKGRSVARATLKGTIAIGLIQGTLGGIALEVAGISGAALWGLVMAVASVIPAVGTALVWIPVVIYLFATGQTEWAIGLAIFFALVVGSVDNLLRPKLVGGDAQMPDLLILITTLGGLTVFGVSGLLIGPMMAGVFITMLDVYQVTFREEINRA